MTEQDQRAWVEMCNWFNDKIKVDEDRVDNVWFNDEPHFNLDGYINSKSFTTAFAHLKGYSLVYNKFENHSGTLLVWG